ncbi:MAG: glycoside hydrolase 43 family protein [Bacteroidetes bacterium]|nr:glycoside hydrolase 43 family protein [Bacteroidota bacterium]
MRQNVVIVLLCFVTSASVSQLSIPKQYVWEPDLGNGMYKNPVIYADYSDPDVIRVGSDYYLVASSFSHFPGLPILHSKDLVNWTLIGHAAHTYPDTSFVLPQHGKGIWAPSIRYHNGEFYIYFGDPDRGIFMTKAKNPAGPWTPLHLVRKVVGWIDPCPFWDDDGNAYLVHAFANSRVGIKSILAINKMSSDGLEIYDEGIVVFVGHFSHPTMEGPKLYKRNGYYYIFAPAGGVKTGWQTVLRSKNIFGPYEDKIVLEQGSTNINGPHQGAWVETDVGEHWFIHFQDRYAYGRIIHLQPMKWENDWPLIGIDYDGNGIGEPVSTYSKPIVKSTVQKVVPQTSDDFQSGELGYQWQWQAIPDTSWYSLTARKGWLRLYSNRINSENLWNVPALLLQKIPAPRCTTTTYLDASSLQQGEFAGVVVFGLDYGSLYVMNDGKNFTLNVGHCSDAHKKTGEIRTETITLQKPQLYLRIILWEDSVINGIPQVKYKYSYSNDGKTFRDLGSTYQAREGIWVGAKIGLFSLTTSFRKERGYADYDFFFVE